MENEKRLHRCCFTGHRPEKLSLSENEVKHLLEKAIDNAIADGYVTFITGMAKGTDIWAAEIVLEKKKRNDDFRNLNSFVWRKPHFITSSSEVSFYRNPVVGIPSCMQYVKAFVLFKSCFSDIFTVKIHLKEKRT